MGGLGSGGARIGTGPKPRSLRDRRLTNARLQPDDRVTTFPPAPPPSRAEPDWEPTPTQRRSLRRRGREFLVARLATYGFSPHEGDILMGQRVRSTRATCGDDRLRRSRRS